MGADEAERLTQFVGVLSDPVRARFIDALLAAEQLCLGDVALALDISQDAATCARRTLRDSCCRGPPGTKGLWRTMPWMVTMFGILVIPLGLSHIALVMSQPAVAHHWSTFALLAAAVMLPRITLTVDEVVAMGQHIRDAKRRGDRGGSVWKVLARGQPRRLHT